MDNEMKKFEVTIDQASVIVEVEAENADEASEKVQSAIERGEYGNEVGEAEIWVADSETIEIK